MSLSDFISDTVSSRIVLGQRGCMVVPTYGNAH